MTLFSSKSLQPYPSRTDVFLAISEFSIFNHSLFLLFNMQVIELQLPSFFNNFDPRAAAANFPSSNKHSNLTVVSFTRYSCLSYALNSCLCELSGVQAYLAGLTFALAASPCSTPVLATLLGYVASTRVLL